LDFPLKQLSLQSVLWKPFFDLLLTLVARLSLRRSFACGSELCKVSLEPFLLLLQKPFLLRLETLDGQLAFVLVKISLRSGCCSQLCKASLKSILLLLFKSLLLLLATLLGRLTWALDDLSLDAVRVFIH
jgi:hypothetical protein